MARLEGITGGLSGKMGSAVFRQSGGKTIASQYQPVVKNPNTEGQQNTRAAFKLMSQLAAIMKDGFGTMGVNERPARGRMSQRNAFFKINYQLVQVTEETGGGVTAKIPMEKLQLTSSFRQLPGFDPDATNSNVNSTHISMVDIPNEVSTLRVVCVAYKEDGTGNQQAHIANIVDLPVTEGEIDRDLQIPSQRVVGDKITLLAFGLIPSSSASKKIDLDNIHTPADESFISAIKLDQMVSDGLISETMTVGINLTVTSN